MAAAANPSGQLARQIFQSGIAYTDVNNRDGLVQGMVDAYQNASEGYDDVRVWHDRLIQYRQDREASPDEEKAITVVFDVLVRLRNRVVVERGADDRGMDAYLIKTFGSNVVMNVSTLEWEVELQGQPKSKGKMPKSKKAMPAAPVMPPPKPVPSPMGMSPAPVMAPMMFPGMMAPFMAMPQPMPIPPPAPVAALAPSAAAIQIHQRVSGFHLQGSPSYRTNAVPAEGPLGHTRGQVLATPLVKRGTAAWEFPAVDIPETSLLTPAALNALRNTPGFRESVFELFLNTLNELGIVHQNSQFCIVDYNKLNSLMLDPVNGRLIRGRITRIINCLAGLGYNDPGYVMVQNFVLVLSQWAQTQQYNPQAHAVGLFSSVPFWQQKAQFYWEQSPHHFGWRPRP
jgi:hypothetical protein